MFRPISYTYVDIVKRVAMGLSIEDGEEMARGLYSIRPHERFTTHILGSAWLCYYVMLAWFWAPMYRDIVLEQAPDQARIYDYELALQAGVRALNIWKVCQRNLGIVVAVPQRRLTMDAEAEPAIPWHWTEVAAAALVIGVLSYWLRIHLPPEELSFAAFTNFYLVGGGAGSADINAGSSIGAASVAATTGGAWVGATNTFTSTGTPFGSVVAGDYASIYVDGATVTGYVAKVASVTSSAIIVLDGTIKYGTKPTDSANARSCVINGSWNTEQVLAAGGIATTTVPQSTKVNIKQATYTVTASRTISMAGATTTPLWFSGYHTTPGDLDADTTNALSKPLLALDSALVLSASGDYTIWSSVSITGSRSASVWSPIGGSVRVVRCRCENTSTNIAAHAASTNVTQWYSYSWFKAPSTATTTGTLDCVGSVWIGVITDTGGTGFNYAGSNAASVSIGCVSLNHAGTSCLLSAANCNIFNYTSYGASLNCIKWISTPGTTNCSVIGCLFSGLNGSTAATNGISNGSGTNTSNVFRACNDYYNVTNPEVGFGDSPAFFPQTDSNPAVTSASDMTPVAGSNALAHGFPGIYENETFSSYPNIGAVMQIAASGGSPGIIGDGSSW